MHKGSNSLLPQVCKSVFAYVVFLFTAASAQAGPEYMGRTVIVK